MPLHPFTANTMADISLVYDCFPKQREFVDDTHRYSVAIAGRGAGKSEGGGIKGTKFMGTYGPTVGCVTAPTYTQLSDTTLQTYFKVIPRELYEYNKSEHKMYFKSGDVIFFRSCDEPDSLRGLNLQWIHMDEMAHSSYEAFQILNATLRHYNHDHADYQQLWGTTTPLGYNWVYRMFGPDSEDIDYRLFNWSVRDNPHVSEKYIKGMEATYEDEFAMQEIEGKFVVTGGKMFFRLQALNDLKHLCREPIEEYRITKIWKRPIPGHHYSAGVDVSLGVGKDRASCDILDCVTGEIVASVHDANTAEDVFAYECNELFTDTSHGMPYKPYVGVEVSGGYGQLFLNKLMDLRYSTRHIYWTGSELNPRYGWNPNAGRKEEILIQLEEAVREAAIIPYSFDAIDEMYAFIRKQKHDDDSERGYKLGAQEGSHDDRVISMALAWFMKRFTHIRNINTPKATSIMKTVHNY